MSESVDLIDLRPKLSSLRDEVLRGLGKTQKELPAKFFYDKRGSELFERITELPEYYLTRTEISILDSNAAEMVDLMGNHFVLIEYGSGSSRKVRILLDKMRGRATYMPIDISLLYLKEAAEALNGEYPDLDVVAVCADYTKPFALPQADGFERRVVFFPGSTVGNLELPLAGRFFRETARKLRRGDGMLIGVDLEKDRKTLEVAYNDGEGITAEFNRNILVRINREVGADFEPNLFDHIAFYNPTEGRIEMHLRSSKEQTVTIAGIPVGFTAGETIHTENSYKYTVGGFHKLLGGTGFVPVRVWTDPSKLFSVHYLTVA